MNPTLKEVRHLALVSASVGVLFPEVPVDAENHG